MKSLISENTSKKLRKQIANKNLSDINLLLLGVGLYTVAYVTNRSDPAYAIVIFAQLVQFIGICCFLYGLFSSSKIDSSTNGYVRLIVTLLQVWFYFLVTWSLDLNYDFIKLMLFGGGGSLLTYVIPLIVFVPKKLLFLKRTKTVVLILGICYFVFLFAFRDSIFKIFDINSVSNEKYIFEYGTKWLSTAVGFILLAYPYFSKKAKFLAFSILLTAFIVATFRARRALMLMSLMPILMASFLYVIHSKNKLLALLATLVFSIGLVGVGYKVYEANEYGWFNTISKRGNEDTRSNVEDCFYEDFEFMDWLIGRGFDGRYFCPNIDDSYEVVGYRPMIETDYLNIILKSGSIYLVLLLLIMIPAIFKGFFQSKNVLSKAASFWILFWIICLYPANVFGFSMHYLTVWLAVAICYSKKIRELPEKTLKRYFALK